MSARSCPSGTRTTPGCARRSWMRSRPTRPGKIRELQDYRFVDPTAQSMFDEMMQQLREDVLGSYFRNMAQGMRDLSPEQLARFRDMLADLNQLIEQRERGEDTTEGFARFMERHGDLFPDRPKTLEELLEQMARRMAAMSRLMASLSPDQRRELRGLAEQMMQDMDLAFEVDRLGANLGSAFPDLPWGDPVYGEGEGAVPMSATVDAMERLHDQEELERALAGRLPGRVAGRRGRGRAAADPRRTGRAGSPPAQADRARPGEGRAGAAARRAARGHSAWGAQDGGARADAGVRGAAARPRGRARRARRGRVRGAHGGHEALALRRSGAAGRAEDGLQRRRSLPARRARSAAPRRLRDGGGRAAHRDGDGAAPGPQLLHAAARPLHPREEDGAGAARPHRGPVSARHAST